MTKVQTKNSSIGHLQILLAGMCWGTTGVFVKLLIGQGLTPEMIAFFRLFSGFLVLLTIILMTDPKLLKIDRKGIFITVIMGLVTQAGFNFFYFNSIKNIGIATSAILLYSAPVFLLIWSVVFFKDRISRKKGIGVLLCVTGSIIAITGGQFDVITITAIGLFFGLSAGLTYSLMTVISKIATRTYQSLTIILYSFLFGAIFLIPLISVDSVLKIQPNFPMLFEIMGIGIISSSLSYLLYFKGIKSGVDIAKAGVISTSELIFAIIFAGFIFSEPIGFVKIIGIGIIFAAILFMQE